MKKKTLTSIIDEGGSLLLRRGAWTHEEDNLLRQCIGKYGEGKWHLVPLRAGLKRCRKSCRLRWLNYLRPHLKRGDFESDEVDLILRLHNLLGNRWSLIAGRIPGRTANDVKNYWNTHLRKKLATTSTLPADQADHQLRRGEDNKPMEKQITHTETSVLRPRPTYARSLIASFAHENNLSNTTNALIINPLTTLLMPQLKYPNYDPNKRKDSALTAIFLDQSKPVAAFPKNQSSSSKSVDHHHDRIEEFQKLENLMFNDNESERSHEAAAGASAWPFTGSEEKTQTDIWSDRLIKQLPLMDGDFQAGQIGFAEFHVDHENVTIMEDMGNSFWL